MEEQKQNEWAFEFSTPSLYGNEKCILFKAIHTPTGTTWQQDIRWNGGAVSEIGNGAEAIIKFMKRVKAFEKNKNKALKAYVDSFK